MPLLRRAQLRRDALTLVGMYSESVSVSEFMGAMWAEGEYWAIEDGQLAEPAIDAAKVTKAHKGNSAKPSTVRVDFSFWCWRWGDTEGGGGSIDWRGGQVGLTVSLVRVVQTPFVCNANQKNAFESDRTITNQIRTN